MYGNLQRAVTSLDAATFFCAMKHTFNCDYTRKFVENNFESDFKIKVYT